MEDRETPRIHKYGETKTTRIMMATVRHVTAWAGRTKYQAAWFLLNRVYQHTVRYHHCSMASVDVLLQPVPSGWIKQCPVAMQNRIRRYLNWFIQFLWRYRKTRWFLFGDSATVVIPFRKCVSGVQFSVLSQTIVWTQNDLQNCTCRCVHIASGYVLKWKSKVTST
jgi:hypothetical protein